MSTAARFRAARGAALGLLVVTVALLAGAGGAGSVVRAQEPTASPSPTAAALVSPNAIQGEAAAPAGPSAPPTFLSLSATPRTIPATGEPRDALFVQLLDAGGNAATAASPLIVRLASTDPRVATVPGSVTIDAGSGAAVVAVTVSSEGSTTIPAQADGLASAQTSLTGQAASVSTQPAAIGVEFAPRAFVSGAGGPAWLTVSVLDGPGGNPVPVAVDTEVRLVSSRPGVVAVPPTVVIPAHEFAVIVDVTPAAIGAATVTALRSGLASATQSIAVLTPSEAESAQLRVVAVPGKLISGSTTQPRFVLQAIAGEEAALAFPCGEIELASSRPGSITVPDRVTPECAPGWQAVVVTGTAGNEAGTTTLTAALPGLEPGLVTVETVGAAVARINATLAPAVPMYGAASAGWLVVEVVDVSGRPAALGADLEVTVDGPPGLAPGSITIPRGSSSVVVPLGRIAVGESPTLRAVSGTLQAAEVTVRPSRASLPVSAGGGGATPAPAFAFGRWRIPVLWVFVPALVGVIGLLAAVVWMTRSPAGGRDGR